MGTTYSRHNSGIDYGLSTADIYKIVRSEQYRQLDDSERLFFNDMIRQGDKYTSMMSAEEIVEDVPVQYVQPILLQILNSMHLYST